MKKLKSLQSCRRKSKRPIWLFAALILITVLIKSELSDHSYQEARFRYQQVQTAVMNQALAETKTHYSETISQKTLEAGLENPVDFNELSHINKDIAAWLEIDTLDISYPILQGNDNSFYLQYLFDGTENPSGSIMLNCDNQLTFKDTNTIIYGHNMRDGSMFGRLSELADAAEAPGDFYVYTPESVLTCHIFAAAYVATDHSIYQIHYHQRSFAYCLEQLKADASYWEEPPAGIRRIVTLSTCSQDQRLVVVAYLVD